MDSTYYSQITMVRTIEQILGAQPMNQKVSRGDPDVRRVHEQARRHAVHAVPNQVPLTEGVTTPPACGAGHARPTGAAARRLNPAAAEKAAVPAARAARRGAVGALAEASSSSPADSAVPDYANPEQMNRYTWYQTHDWKVPYPGDSRIYAPTQVPGAYIPSPDSQ